MAKKQPLPPEPPSVPPERGIELLRRQQEKATQLLANRPLDSDAYEAWQLTTRAYLVSSFGSDSANVGRVMNAGKIFTFGGETKEWYEESCATCLATQVKLLDSCIEQLEAKVESGGVQASVPGTRLDFDCLHSTIVARCRGLFEAGEYENAVFTAMKCVEDRIRTRINGDPTDTGVKLVAKAMGSQSPPLVFSEVDAEQQGAASLYRGALAYLKNPSSHRFLGTNDPDRTLEALAFASLLLRMLDEATLEGA